MASCLIIVIIHQPPDVKKEKKLYLFMIRSMNPFKCVCHGNGMYLIINLPLREHWINNWSQSRALLKGFVSKGRDKYLPFGRNEPFISALPTTQPYTGHFGGIRMHFMMFCPILVQKPLMAVPVKLLHSSHGNWVAQDPKPPESSLPEVGGRGGKEGKMASREAKAGIP